MRGPVPEPPADRRYNGTLTLRVPSDTQRVLALDATEAEVGMNRVATEQLTLRR